jgi:membrane-bound inhibitor of C-type lysozyme
MRSVLLLSSALICLLLSSCQQNEKTRGRPATQTKVTGEIIRDTVTDKDGRTLAMTFNNAKQTATLVWQGETIELRQDRMASGIKYSNPIYELTEHQGVLTLSKGRNVVFNHKK